LTDPKLGICSHRTNASEVGGDSATPSALRLLWSSGIECFDLDVVQTRDGALLAAHPSRLQSFLSTTSPRNAGLRSDLYSHAQLKTWGASETAIPLLKDVAEEFSSLVRQKLLATVGSAGSAKDSLLLLDLKGAAFSRVGVTAVAHLVKELGIQDNTLVWVPDTHPRAAELVEAARQAAPELGLLQGFPDRRSGWGRTAVGDSFRAVGPVVNAPRELFAEAAARRLPAFAWLVNSRRDLLKAAEVGSRFVISDEPVAMLREAEASDARRRAGGGGHSARGCPQCAASVA